MMTRQPFSADQLERLGQVCADEPQVLALFLFGSQANGYATAYSDVDLAVLLTEPLPFQAQLSFEAKICQALGREDVDLLLLNSASVLLRFRAISGQLLYERAPDPVSDFIQQTLMEYYDFQPVLDTYRREFARSLEDDYDL
jgi:uncharacterized protein